VVTQFAIFALQTGYILTLSGKITMKVFINHEFFDEADAKISVFDHGLLYGDGIFEGIRIYQKCIFKLDEHLERLEYSAKAIMLELPWTRQEISDACVAACEKNNLTDGYIRLVVTRGKGSLGLSPKSCSNPQLIIIADKITLYPAEYYTKGLKIVTSATRRINPSAFPPMVKSLNYLNNIMAKMDAMNAGCFEAIMLNDQGYIAECTGDNLFIVQKGKIYTPPVIAGSLNGITRGTVFELATELGIEIIERNLTRFDVWIADECFLSGTAAEVVPVSDVDGRPICGGTSGPITKRLMESFHKKVALDGRRY
jgi:branched-chain amino acid aminotransferase